MTADETRKRTTSARRLPSRNTASAGRPDATPQADVSGNADWPADGISAEVILHSQDDDFEPSPRRNRASLQPAAQCALLMLQAAIAAKPDFLLRCWDRGAISVLQAPTPAWGFELALAWDVLSDHVMAAEPYADIVDAAQADLAAISTAGAQRGRRRQHVVIALDPALKNRAENQVHIALQNGEPFVGISHDPESLFHPVVLLAEDQRLVVEPPDDRILVVLAKNVSPMAGDRLDAMPVVPTEVADAARSLTPSLIQLAGCPGLTADGFLERLAELLRRQEARGKKKPRHSSVTLETLPGLGAADTWGRHTARDLRAFAEGKLAWSDLDRGVVLEGPPGCGKSTFARALANSAGVDFLAASLAQWQGDRDSHLGTLLGAMRRTFAEARRKSPCVLLIDEIDSFPNRKSLRHHYRDYAVQVVNGLLEQLDGATEREGVLVVATCNDASGLDGALTRAGRLERIVQVTRPDTEALVQIFRIHLAGELADTDLVAIAEAARAKRAVGADVELWCREARRAARASGMSLSSTHLWAVLGGPPPERDEATRRRIAIHEAGHAVAYADLGVGMLNRVSVGRTGAADFTQFDARPLVSRLPVVTAAVARSLIGALLAGRAAEEEILGTASAGAGGSPHSDLAMATRIACQTIGMLGLDDHPEALVHLGDIDRPGEQERLLADPAFRARVAAMLTRCHQDVRGMIHARRVSLNRIAEILVEKGEIGADALLLLLGPDDAPRSGDVLASPDRHGATRRRGRSE